MKWSVDEKFEKSVNLMSTEYTVAGLVDGEEYEFRVSPENLYGQSILLECENQLLQKILMANVSQGSANVEVGKQKENSVTLKWDKLKMMVAQNNVWEIANDYSIKGNEFTVDNLSREKPYEFRVKAKSAAGWEEYTKLDRPVTFKSDSVAPSSPDMPEVKQVGKNYVELACIIPTNDGDSKITGYVVEKRPAGTDQWVKASPYMSVDNNAVITDLPENGEVEFRVKANNKAGESEPSSISGRVKITEYPNGRAPTFVKKLTNTSALPNGEATFTIEFDANPASEVECRKGPFKFQVRKDDQSLTDGDHTERGDAGKYAISVTNNSGSCNAPLKVKIITPPLPRTGPLEISNVSKDRATLSWKPLKDDGGSKVTGYVVERRDTSKGADALIPVTQACKETTFTVPSLLDGHENGTGEPLHSTAPTTAKLPFKPPGSSGQPDITGMTNNTVTLD
ncbi:unnamed protein product [Adineta steineri]|uniref:Fibronectin type-III domain-containing protein n=1 Tax=Adineta steineri TaxID=433720 RepID=A0A815DN63_9BILA|nr:unnamed protein product [Adineta steineri]CAF1303305.1 unnamed protein product [Adineta steineri]CAF1304351.1 unnamed protein product [Adineta steineri]